MLWRAKPLKFFVVKDADYAEWKSSTIIARDYSSILITLPLASQNVAKLSMNSHLDVYRAIKFIYSTFDLLVRWFHKPCSGFFDNYEWLFWHLKALFCIFGFSSKNPFWDQKKQQTKGQLISKKCPFGVFKSSKKPTIFFQDFCPSL